MAGEPDNAAIEEARIAADHERQELAADQPSSPTRPALLTRTSSSSSKKKKGKKGKKAAKLGTISPDDNNAAAGTAEAARLSPEQVRETTERDTAEAVEGWFADDDTTPSAATVEATPASVGGAQSMNEEGEKSESLTPGAEVPSVLLAREPKGGKKKGKKGRKSKSGSVSEGVSSQPADPAVFEEAEAPLTAAEEARDVAPEDVPLPEADQSPFAEAPLQPEHNAETERQPLAVVEEPERGAERAEHEAPRVVEHEQLPLLERVVGVSDVAAAEQAPSSALDTEAADAVDAAAVHEPLLVEDAAVRDQQQQLDYTPTLPDPTPSSLVTGAAAPQTVAAEETAPAFSAEDVGADAQEQYAEPAREVEQPEAEFAPVLSRSSSSKKKKKKGKKGGSVGSGSGFATPVDEEMREPVVEQPAAAAVVEETPVFPSEEGVPAAVGVEEALADAGATRPGDERVGEAEAVPVPESAPAGEVDLDAEFAPVSSSSSKKNKKKKKKGKKGGSGSGSTSAGLVTPVEEESIGNGPVFEPLAVEQPDVEEQLYKEPDVEEHLAEQPVAEQPTAQEPMDEASMPVQPVAEEPEPAETTVQAPEHTVPEFATEHRDFPAEEIPDVEASTPAPEVDPEDEFAPVVSSKKKKRKKDKKSGSVSASGFATPIEEPASITFSVEEAKPSETTIEEPQQTVTQPALEETSPAADLAPTEKKPVSVTEDITDAPVVDERGVQEVLEEGTAAVQPAEPEIPQPSFSTDFDEQAAPDAELQQAEPFETAEADPESEFVAVPAKKKKKGKKGRKSVSESPIDVAPTPVEEVVQEPESKATLVAPAESELDQFVEAPVSEAPNVDEAAVEAHLEQPGSKDMPRESITEPVTTVEEGQVPHAVFIPLPDADSDQDLAEPQDEVHYDVPEKSGVFEPATSEQATVPEQVDEVRFEAGPENEFSPVPSKDQHQQEEDTISAPETFATPVHVEEVQEKQPHFLFGPDVPLSESHREDPVEQVPLPEDEREEFKEAERAMEPEPIFEDAQEKQPGQFLGADPTSPGPTHGHLPEQLSLPGDERKDPWEADRAFEVEPIGKQAPDEQPQVFDEAARVMVETDPAVAEVQEKQPSDLFGAKVALPEGDDKQLPEQLTMPEDERREFDEAERAMEIGPKRIAEEPVVEKGSEASLPTAISPEAAPVPVHSQMPELGAESQVLHEPSWERENPTTATPKDDAEPVISGVVEVPEALAESHTFDDLAATPIVSEPQPELAVSDVELISEPLPENQTSREPFALPQETATTASIHETQPEDEWAVKPSKKKKSKKGKKSKASGQSSVDITEPSTPAERSEPQILHEEDIMNSLGTSHALEQPAENLEAVGGIDNVPEMGAATGAEREPDMVDREHGASHDFDRSITQEMMPEEEQTAMGLSSTDNATEPNFAVEEPVSALQPSTAEEAANIPLPSETEEPLLSSDVANIAAVEKIHDEAIAEPQQMIEPEHVKEAPVGETAALGQDPSAAIEAQPEDEWSVPSKSKKDKKKKKKRGSVAQTPIESSAPGSPRLEASGVEDIATVASPTQGEPAIIPVDQLQPAEENVEAASEITPAATHQPASVADDLRGPAPPAALMPIDPGAPVSEENPSNLMAEESREETPLHAGEWELPTQSKEVGEEDKERDDVAPPTTGQGLVEEEAVPADGQISSTTAATPLLETAEPVPRDADDAWTVDPAAVPPSAHHQQSIAPLQSELAEELPKDIEAGVEPPVVEEAVASPAVPEAAAAEDEWAYMPAKKNKKGKKGKKQDSISSTLKEIEQAPEPFVEPVENERATDGTTLQSAPAETTGEEPPAPFDEPPAPVEAGEDEWALPAKKKKGKKGKKGFADIVQEAVQAPETPTLPEQQSPEQVGQSDDKIEESAPVSLEFPANVSREAADEATDVDNVPFEPSARGLETSITEEIPGDEQPSSTKPLSDVVTEEPIVAEPSLEQPKEADAEDLWAVPTRKKSKKKKKGKQMSLDEPATPPTTEPSAIEDVAGALPMEEPRDMLEVEETRPEVVPELSQPETLPELSQPEASIETPTPVVEPTDAGGIGEAGEANAEDEWAPAPTSSKKKKKKAKKDKQGSVSEILPTPDEAPPAVEEKAVEEHTPESKDVEFVSGEQPQPVVEPVLDVPSEVVKAHDQENKDVDFVPSEQPKQEVEEPAVKAVEEHIPDHRDLGPQLNIEPVTEELTDKVAFDEPSNEPIVEEQPAEPHVVEEPFEASIEQTPMEQSLPSEPVVTDVASVQPPQEAGEDEWDIPVKQKKKKGKKGKRDSTPGTPPVVEEVAPAVVEESTVPLDTASPIVEESTPVTEVPAPVAEESTPIAAETEDTMPQLSGEPKSLGDNDDLKDIPTSVELVNQESSAPIEGESQQDVERTLSAADPSSTEAPTQETGPVHDEPHEAQPEDLWALPTRKKSKKGKKGKKQSISTTPAESSDPQPEPEIVSGQQLEDTLMEPQESTPIEVVSDEEFSMPLSKKDKKKQKKKAAATPATAAAVPMHDSPPFDDTVADEVPAEQEVPRAEQHTEWTAPPLSFADAANLLSTELSDSKRENFEPPSLVAQSSSETPFEHEGMEEVKDKALSEEPAVPHIAEDITSEHMSQDRS
ncbi:hypothetical protein UCDDS831_g01476 [Diplodia seriata]|uniref:Uncharacterized protein n=1 Tax=Diplodia seriata TaxID=420778 RepID=A0A0G2EWB6_9PEZI|nr:hypothetical protein UCDDS831_g01476 [Diplodia seriata]